MRMVYGLPTAGASCHMTYDRTRIYNVRPPPPGRETITIGDCPRIRVEYIEDMDVIFHGKTEDDVDRCRVPSRFRV